MLYLSALAVARNDTYLAILTSLRHRESFISSFYLTNLIYQLPYLAQMGTFNLGLVQSMVQYHTIAEDHSPVVEAAFQILNTAPLALLIILQLIDSSLLALLIILLLIVTVLQIVNACQLALPADVNSILLLLQTGVWANFSATAECSCSFEAFSSAQLVANSCFHS